ncbi:MAG: DUF2191 domain-containing protein [Deltaproteobacteria bacterium]|nr:DUF2191 domain-containing protein [Deltaproteobacteria bacterium]
MKTTFEISDALLARVKRHAQRTGRPMRVLVEEGLRLVLEAETRADAYRMPDLSVGEPAGDNPLERLSWSELRAEIYAEP